MSQTIADFYTQAQSKDFARKFQFRIGQWTVAGVQLLEDQLVYLETAALPGRQITNVPVPFMGLQFNVPGTATYPDSSNYQVRFRCDANYDIRAALENATFNTFDEKTSKGFYNTPTISSIIVLKLYDKNNQPIREYTLNGAWVQAIGSSQYEIGDSGSIQTVDAVLAYQYWLVTDTKRNVSNII